MHAAAGSPAEHAPAGGAPVAERRQQTGQIRRWSRGQLLGSGGFGRVYLAHNTDSHQLFAVKQVRRCERDVAARSIIYVAGCVRDEAPTWQGGLMDAIAGRAVRAETRQCLRCRWR